MTDLREARLTDLLPETIANQQWMKSLSDAWHSLSVMILDLADDAQVYTAIDRAPDELLDILAVQFKVDWYKDDYPIETKRKLIKTAMEIKRYCGTRWAVQQALSEIYQDANISEWYEYDGEPGYWRITANITEGISEYYTPKEIEKKINYARRCTAHLEGVTYEIAPKSLTPAYAAATPGGMATFCTVRLPGTIQPRAVQATAHAAGMVSAARMRATVSLPGVIRPRAVRAEAFAAGQAAHTYETVTIKIGGTLL